MARGDILALGIAYGTTTGSPDPVQEGTDKSVNDLRAFVTPDTAGEIGITLGALRPY